MFQPIMGVKPISKDSSQQMAMMIFALRPVTRLLYLRRFNKLFELEHERNIKVTSEEHQRNIGETSEEHLRNILKTSEEHLGNIWEPSEEHLRNGLITIIINSSSNIFLSVFLETPGRWTT